MNDGLLKRWIWGPMETEPGTEYPHPVCKAYCTQWYAPATGIHETHTLCKCYMSPIQLEAAKLDPRLTILTSLHDKESKIHDDIVTKLGKHGVHGQMDTHKLLTHLAKKIHPAFEPEE